MPTVFVKGSINYILSSPQSLSEACSNSHWNLAKWDEIQLKGEGLDTFRQCTKLSEISTTAKIACNGMYTSAAMYTSAFSFAIRCENETLNWTVQISRSQWPLNYEVSPPLPIYWACISLDSWFLTRGTQRSSRGYINSSRYLPNFTRQHKKD